MKGWLMVLDAFHAVDAGWGVNPTPASENAEHHQELPLRLYGEDGSPRQVRLPFRAGPDAASRSKSSTMRL